MRILLLPLLLFATQAIAQAPRQLEGLHYRGTAEARWQEGCEGCGNPGHVEFLEEGLVDYSLPGSDTPGRMSYTRSGDRIILEPGNWSMEFKGDSLFFTAYGYRHTYVRQRR